jgi:hypothetical protein
MIDYTALFDELEKIAEEKKDRWITKEKLKRHAAAIPVIGAGALVGHFGGRAAKHALLQRKGAIQGFLRKHPTLAKVAPAAAGATAGAAALFAASRSKKHRQHVEKTDDQPK